MQLLMNLSYKQEIIISTLEWDIYFRMTRIHNQSLIDHLVSNQ